MGSIQIAELWIDTYRLCYSSIYCTTFYTHMSFKYSIYAEGSFEVMILWVLYTQCSMTQLLDRWYNQN